MFGKKKKKGKEKMFEYCIENVTNEETFKAQCSALEENLIDLIDDGITRSDDDNSPMQFYLYRDMKITVMYDVQLQEVYVDAPIDVGEYIIESEG